MKRLVFALAIATSLFAANPEEAVKKAEKEWATAIKSADTALLQKVLADDLTYCHSNGVMDTKASYIDSIRSGKLKYLEANHESMNVRMLGNTAVLTGRIDVKTINNGQEMTAKLALLHVYEKRKGHWQMIAHQSARLAQ